MNSRDISHGQIKPVAKSLRAALLCGALRVVATDVQELADDAAPIEQVLDRALWLAPGEMEEGMEERISALIDDFQEQLEALGIGAIGLIFLGSEAGLFAARGAIRKQLYGQPQPQTAPELEQEMTAP